MYTNFLGLNVSEDGAECETFIIILLDSLLVYENKDYLQIYLDNCASKVLDKQLVDNHGDHLFNSN